MSTPHVTEITRRLEPVGHDDFIDDLGIVAPTSAPRPAPRPRPPR